MTKNNQNWKYVDDKKKYKNKKIDKGSSSNQMGCKQESEKEPENVEENRNLKKILCQNIIECGECKYGNKCLYAHNLNEQNIDYRRRIVYNIINSTDDLTFFDLRENYTTYRLLLELTKLCKDCDEGKCIGGYNCKTGACMKKYCVCLNDLNNGNCKNAHCCMIHLTKRGLKPFYNKQTPLGVCNKFGAYKRKYGDYSYKKLDEKQNATNSDGDNISNISEISEPDSTKDEENIQIRANDEKYVQYICEKSIFD